MKRKQKKRHLKKANHFRAHIGPEGPLPFFYIYERTCSFAIIIGRTTRFGFLVALVDQRKFLWLNTQRPSDYSRIKFSRYCTFGNLPLNNMHFVIFLSFFKRSVGNWVVRTPLSLSGTVSLFHQTSFRFYI